MNHYKKQITYFDPHAADSAHPNGNTISFFVHSQEELDENLAILNNPKRGITDISVTDAPPSVEEYKARLDEIDRKSTRAIRAIQSGKGTAADEQYLFQLELEAEEIRAKMQELQ
ncbi:MAG: hypothetical protein FWG44_03170 [Oscillospiraceae bacterium]|nr:hypothetical protein [Oscillospiraceae bacterium]